MIRKKKILVPENMPDFDAGIAGMEEESRIFVDKSLEISHYIHQVMTSKGMKQKDLAEKMGKSEAEVSKLLGGMHNYTLRSIAKMEAALGTTLIFTPAHRNISFPKSHQQKSIYAVTEKRIDPTSAQPNLSARIVPMKNVGNIKMFTQAI